MSSAESLPEVIERGLGQVLLLNNPTQQRQTMQLWLNTEGFQTTICMSGEDLEMELSQHHPDLVVMGTDLNDIEALTLCTSIRAWGGVPIMALASRGDVDSVKLLELGADVVIIEPILQFEFLARVRALLRRTPPRSTFGNKILSFGGMRLDREHQVLQTETQSIQLEGREFLLMEALMLSGTRVISRRKLEASLALRSPDLDGYIRRLRQRIEEIEGWRRIVNEHGLGLRLLNRRP